MKENIPEAQNYGNQEQLILLKSAKKKVRFQWRKISFTNASLVPTSLLLVIFARQLIQKHSLVLFQSFSCKILSAYIVTL